MDANAKLVIGGLVGLLGCGGLCVCAGLLGMGSCVANAPQLEVEIETAQREGTRDGSAGDTEGCLARGYDRGVACGYGINCGVVIDEYLRACLRSVPNPDASLCIGAPAPSMMGDLAFDERVCGARGWPVDSPGCSAVTQSVATYCATY